MSDESGILIFTADLPHLLEEAARLLVAVDSGGAGCGLIFGFQVAQGHMRALAEVAHDLGDPVLLLRLYALGIVSDPVPSCRERGTWSDEHTELARQVGLDA